MTGFVHSVETMGLFDGPGIRSVVFLHGCPLRCGYCHNPDTWGRGGMERTSEELVAQLLRQRPYFQSSGGGVTFSGGDPLVQSAFTAACFQQLKAQQIHTCLDTSGAVAGDFSHLLAHTDLVLYDVKHYRPDDYRALTGGELSITQDFLAQVQRAGIPLWIRHVVVPGLTDSESHLQGLREYIAPLQNVKKVELLPYHTMGLTKYQALQLPYPMADIPPMDKARCTQLQQKYFEE